MIELQDNELCFSFPDVHAHARLGIQLQRTLRIPDNGKSYPLPPGLGRFPMRHIDDFASEVNESWLQRGGVLVPMYQAEALWISFRPNFAPHRSSAYPFAVKVAAGKINAVTGEEWSPDLSFAPQNFLSIPAQPWLDGYCVQKGFIRQFVAMPLGAGYSAEEQITGEAEFGGLQVEIFPMKAAAYDRRFPVRKQETQCLSRMASAVCSAPAMGLAPGGRMKQEICRDPFDPAEWEMSQSSRVFIHLVNSQVWREITGDQPPHPPVTAAEYARSGLPWFEFYSEVPALPGSKTLSKLKSVAKMGKKKGDQPLVGDPKIPSPHVIQLGSKNKVREGKF